MRSELLAASPRIVARAGQAVEVPPDTAVLFVEEGVVVSAVSGPNRRFSLSFAAAGDIMLPPTTGVVVEALRPSLLRVVSPDVRCRLFDDPDTAPVRSAHARRSRARDAPANGDGNSDA